jgi:hypothetical protein
VLALRRNKRLALHPAMAAKMLDLFLDRPIAHTNKNTYIGSRNELPEATGTRI